MYICLELNEATNSCDVWAPYESVLPPLSVAEGLALASAALTVWALAWGVRLIASTIINR